MANNGLCTIATRSCQRTAWIVSSPKNWNRTLTAWAFDRVNLELFFIRSIPRFPHAIGAKLCGRWGSYISRWATCVFKRYLCWHLFLKKHFSPNKKFILIMIYVIAIFNPIFNVFGCTVLPWHPLPNRWPRQLWLGTAQVSVGQEAPALATPIKPKYYLLGSVSVGAGQAIKLK